MNVAQIPRVGETVTEGVFSQVFGGKGANQAVAAARAGGAVAFVTGLGDDLFAPQLLEHFAAERMNTEACLVVAGKACGSAMILVDEAGNNSIAVAPGANDALTPAYLDSLEPLIARSALVVMQLELPLDTTERALAVAQRNMVPTLFTYAPVRGAKLAVSAQMTYLVVNEGEAEELSQMPTNSVEAAKRAAVSLQARGPKVVIVTLGPDGIVVATESDSTHYPAFASDAIDTTAAGDTFCGALATALTEERALPEALRFAQAAAAIGVTRRGAQPSIPTRAEIEAFLAI